jgi:deaminated glutathione amidase
MTTAKKSTTSKSVNSGFGKAKPIRGIFRIAAIQMASGPVVEGNIAEADRLIETAAIQGASLVALPEHWALMGNKDTDKVAAREKPGKGPIQDFLSSAAKRHKIWIIGGSIPIEASVADKVRNTSLLYDDQGKCVARYDKIHLFGLDMGQEKFNESKTIEPGDKVVVVDTPFGKLGLSVCYDLRFPELYRAMKQVDVIAIPSAFTETTGRAHWEALIRARAIENMAYVIAPAQGGYHRSGRETHGDTMIVDPWGVVMDRLSRGSGIVIAGMNPSYQASLRKSLPALGHRTIHRL